MFSITYGLDWIASGPPTVRLLSSIVGAERIGIMVAWITVVHQLGSASAAYIGGVLRIAFGTYLEAFMMSGMLLLAAARSWCCSSAPAAAAASGRRLRPRRCDAAQ